MSVRQISAAILGSADSSVLVMVLSLIFLAEFMRVFQHQRI
jgi:hypothetical protein